MKLKKGFILRDVGDEHMMVATGKATKSFNGLVRNNETADSICRLLTEDTTEERIVDALCERYDAPREQIAGDVSRTLATLRDAGFLDE